MGSARDDNPVGTQLARWVGEQLAPWRVAGLTRRAVGRTLAACNTSYPDIFVFDFADGDVTLRGKPQYSPADLEGGASVLARRAQLYLRFFRFLAAAHDFPRGTLALTTEDYRESAFDVPIFAFQKRAGTNYVLLPDCDALTYEFYDYEADDELPFRDKHDRAFFAGATTSGHNTLASVAALENPRLRAGVYFKGREEADFRLPSIVRCDSAATAAAIRALGFGAGEVGWTEHLRHKFLISIDGNGATCSRVAKALRSRCALLKYASPFELYYFSGLEPGRHYLPIEQDSDVIAIVRQERRDRGHFEHVAMAGRDFFSACIARGPALHYAAMLLQAYFATLGAGSGGGEGVDTDITAMLHVHHRGDAVGSPAHWLGAPGHAVEGFALLADDTLAKAGLRYCALDANGGLAPPGWVGAGAVAGLKDSGQPIFGFAVRLGEASLACRYSGRFAAGSVVGPCHDGAPCRSDTPLEAVRLTIGPRG